MAFSYDGGYLLGKIKVRFAWGYGPTTDSGTWVWTDETAYVRLDSGITINKGRPDEASASIPATVTFSVNNTGGRFTPGLATSANYPNVVLGTPVQILLYNFGDGLNYERATLFVSSYTLGWDVSTRAPIVTIVAAGRLRQLQRRQAPLKSPMVRAALAVTPTELWPFEDGSGATAAGSALTGHNTASATNVTFSGDSTMAGARTAATLSASSLVVGTVQTFTATGFWGVGAAFKLSAVAATTTLFSATSTGTAPTWTVSISPASPDTFNLNAYDTDGSSLLSVNVSTVEADLYGGWTYISLQLTQSGSDINYLAGYSVALPVVLGGGSATGAGVTGTLSSRTIGIPKVVTVTGSAGLDGAGFGQLGVFPQASFSGTSIAANLNGNASIAPTDRFANLCTNQGVPYQLITGAGGSTGTDLAMGPEPVGTFVDAIRECEAVDGGAIHDGGPSGWLVFVSRASHYNASVAFTIDASAGQLQPDITPTFDDQRTLNDVTVERSSGASARYELSQGDGVYDATALLNLYDDTYQYQIAGWKVGIGTAAGMRYPRSTVNFRRSPTLAQSWLACVVGNRFQETHLPAEHPTGTVDQILEGYTEFISTEQWTVSLAGSPFSPYQVGVFDDATLGHFDTAGSSLTANVSIGAGSMSVATTTGPIWTTDPANFPFAVRVSGIDVTVTAISGASSPQTFTVTGATITKALHTNDDVRLSIPSTFAL